MAPTKALPPSLQIKPYLSIMVEGLLWTFTKKVRLS
jgi:hypothetical protein